MVLRLVFYCSLHGYTLLLAMQLYLSKLTARIFLQKNLRGSSLR